MTSTKPHTLIITALFCFTQATAQHPTDTTNPSTLKEVRVTAWQRADIGRLPDDGPFSATGKKSEAITVAGTAANIALKTPRQLFAKVPGLFVYDMDGSGNQMAISTRGLDAHRSWELNNRQNGVLINSDIYGYPASHYSAPVESYERIEIVRGTGALQYGAQFGGMVNYITKRPDSAKAFGLEAVNSLGSQGLMSSYTAVGGTHKKFSYYAYYHRRHSDGYRQNSSSDATAQFVQLGYRFSNRLVLKAELGRSKYLHHLPGPLNDSMFNANPKQSTRGRNYYSPDIYVPSLTMQWTASPRTKVLLLASGVYGVRNSVLLDALATVPDTINRATGQYRARQVDIDNFRSRTVEGKLLHTYTIGAMQSRLVTGFMYTNNNMRRRQLGCGTTGTDYDLSVEGAFVRNLRFRSQNIALFAENAFALSSRWSISPGLRLENGSSKMSGTIAYYTVNPLPTTIRHSFVLAGISSQFLLGRENTLYGGISQAYRPVIFKDIIPASVFEQIDNNLKNAKGYNAELGLRGKIGRGLQYDLSLFRVLYQNRLGSVLVQDGSNPPYIFRTTVGDSRTNGIEAFVQYKFPLSSTLYAGLFTSTSYMDARYTRGSIASAGANKNITGNRVEAVPEWISRNGFEALYKGFSATVQYSYTSSTFADPLNTVVPPPSGAVGLTPGYSIWDVNAVLRFNAIFSLRAGMGNVFNKQYFTKRPTFYPGPGIWPSDGRNGYLTVGVRI